MALPFSNRVGSGLQREYIRDEAVRLFKKNKDVDTEEGTVVKMLSILLPSAIQTGGMATVYRMCIVTTCEALPV